MDTLSGQTAAFAILAVLLRREHGGGGDYIGVAMLDASPAFIASAVVPYLVTGKALERTGNTGYSAQSIFALFTAAGGRLISLGVVEQQQQFEALARRLGREDWITDQRFAYPDLRRTTRSAKQEELGVELRRKSAGDWEALMSKAGIPCGMVRDVGEAASFAHLREREALLPLTIPGLPENRKYIDIANAGFRMAQDRPIASEAPPRLGQHTQEILACLDREN